MWRSLLLLLSCLVAAAQAENYEYANGYDDQYNNMEQQQGDDYIKYWTDYAILPKRCIIQ